MSRTMKAMVYRAANDIGVEDRPVPTILAPTDAIIRMTKTTICGTDLGIWKGKNPEIAEVAKHKTGQFDGRILGHEGIGIARVTERIAIVAGRVERQRHVVIQEVARA